MFFQIATASGRFRGACKNLCLAKYLREPEKEELYIDNPGEHRKEGMDWSWKH